MHARHRRRTRRIRRNLGICAFGTIMVAAMLWLSTEPGTEVRVAADLAAMVGGNTAPDTATTLSWADEVASAAQAGTATVLSDHGTETLALALVVRDGFLITSGRALKGRTEVLVAWGDNVEMATVIGYDALTDVSVIRLDAAVLPASGPDAGALQPGDMIALVNPEGASEPRMVVDPMSTSSSSDGVDLIGIVELDRSLGNLPPGAPAVDEHGAVVGIASATAEYAPAAVVPIEVARDVADQIIEFGEASHPRIGITARDITEADDVSAEGAYVAAVDPDGAAAAGGMELGDVIVSIQGTAVTSMAEMIGALRSHDPGDVIKIVVHRGNRLVDCTVDLGSHLDAAD